jgi:DNA polymerase-1
MTQDAPTFLSLDIETEIIQPGLLLPPIVVASATTGTDTELLHGWEDTRDTFLRCVENGCTFVGANIAYDMAVLMAEAQRHDEDSTITKAVFSLYRDGHIFDVLIAHQLDAIGKGMLSQPIHDPSTKKQNTRPNLSIVTYVCTGRIDAKRNDFWKLRYAVLQYIPPEEWPADALQYPKDDTENALTVAKVQAGVINAPGIHDWHPVDGDNPFGPEQCKRCAVVWDSTKPYDTIQKCVGAKVEYENLGNMTEQARAALSLFLGDSWGLRTSPERVALLDSRVEKAHADLMVKFGEAGWLKPDGKEDQPAIKRAVALAYGADPLSHCPTCEGSGKVPKPKGKGMNQCKACSATGLDLRTAPTLPKTPTDGIKKDRDTLKESGDDLLAELGDNEEEKTRGTYLPWLKEGTARPLTLRSNVLLANGRTSYDGLIQLLPRGSLQDCKDPAHPKHHGRCVFGCDVKVRECLQARPGWLFSSIDISAFELCTLAQVCLWTVGYSKMAETINATGDPGALHTALAAKMIGVPFDELKARIKAKDLQAKNFRQAAKPGNFGFPGGMGEAKFVLTNRPKSKGTTVAADGKVYDGIRFCILIHGALRCGIEKITEYKRQIIPPTCKACIEAAKELRKVWFELNPEMRQYFQWVNSCIEQFGKVPCLSPLHKDNIVRWRGGVTFTDAANNGFSALAADAVKHALWKVTEEAFTDEQSPMYGTVHPISLIHDEIFSEVWEPRAHEASIRETKVMVDAVKEWVPDVTIIAEPALSRFMSKEAEPVFVDGRLIPWEDRP